MKQLLILSGKGGTGKTTLAGAFIKLAEAKAFADCDVDAPNLHLVMMQSTEPKHTDYYGLPKAKINPELCVGCGKCKQHCRFDAILSGEKYRINQYACEGCGVCEIVCPEKAITLTEAIAGDLMLYCDTEKVFSTAKLKMGSGTSGKLVTEVKKQLKSKAGGAELAIIDGSPGIGCPVIASLSGVDMVLIVAEPSLSGISDMIRIIETARIFKTKTVVCINKYDINIKNTTKIKEYCGKEEIPIVGEVPFDKSAIKAINNGMSIVDIDCAAATAIQKVYTKTTKLLLDVREDNLE